MLIHRPKVNKTKSTKTQMLVVMSYYGSIKFRRFHFQVFRRNCFVLAKHLIRILLLLSGAYLGLRQISMMKIFCKNSLTAFINR